mgnify:CR=1 FL=1
MFDMPMLIKDNAQADAVTLDHLDYWQDMMEKEGGFSCLTIFETGWRTITNNKREIRSAADCEGLRIRVMQNNNYIDIWQRLGCDPVPMDMAEAFTAMQQGAIDGQDNPAIFCISNNIPEVNKYFSPINYIYSCIPVIMNTAAWDSLSSEDQEIFAECAYERRFISERPLASRSRRLTQRWKRRRHDHVRRGSGILPEDPAAHGGRKL